MLPCATRSSGLDAAGVPRALCGPAVAAPEGRLFVGGSAQPVDDRIGEEGRVRTGHVDAEAGPWM
jgi:hypothetical protein